MEVSPYEAAVAVARLQQEDPAAAARLLSEYLNEGLSPLRLTYAMGRMLGEADERICRTSFQPRGAWLGRLGVKAAAHAASAATPVLGEDPGDILERHRPREA